MICLKNCKKRINELESALRECHQQHELAKDIHRNESRVYAESICKYSQEIKSFQDKIEELELNLKKATIELDFFKYAAASSSDTSQEKAELPSTHHKKRNHKHRNRPDGNNTAQ